MIVAFAQLELFVTLVDPSADRGSSREVEWCPLNRAQLSGWNQAGIDRGEAGSIERQQVIQNGVPFLRCNLAEISPYAQIDGETFIFCVH